MSEKQIRTESQPDSESRALKLPRAIDGKIPLTWLVSSAVSMILAFGGIFAKLETVTSSIQRLDARSEQRDERVGLLLSDIAVLRGEHTAHKNEASRLAKELERLREDYERFRRENNK